VIGDLISPFKTAIGLDYKAFETKLLNAIHRRFRVPAPLPSEVAFEIKRADRIAAFYEATVLAGFAREEALRFFGGPGGIDDDLARCLVGICSLPPDAAQRAFLDRFSALEAAN
jgi:5'-deoxynucleotidase YfbR-like HD superfamily hydrolase